MGLHIFIEVYESLKQHSIRTLFTGFGVVWAMLLWVLFQGGGNGFYNGMVQKFSSFRKDLLAISIHSTSTGTLRLTEALAKNLAHGLPFFEHVVPLFRTQSSLQYKEEKQESIIVGIDANYPEVQNFEIVEGRFFSQRGIQAGPPICVLNKQAKVQLLGEKSAIGKCLWLHNTAVHIIGVIEMSHTFTKSMVLIPSTLFKTLFPTETIKTIVGVIKPNQDHIALKEKTQSYLNRQLQTQDQDAVYVRIPSSRESKLFKILFLIIQGFIGFISCCLLLSGVVGINNMMLVMVKERTKELAIRKLLGASTKHIVWLIVLESIIIHLFSGTMGMGIGIGLLKWANCYLLPLMKLYHIAYLELKYTIVLTALVVLLITSCLAAIVPTKRALYIKPIDALNNE